MKIYVVDRRGEDAAQEIEESLRRLGYSKHGVEDVVVRERPPVNCALPALFFVHSLEADRLRLEDLLCERHKDDKWALVHYGSGGGGQPRPIDRSPKIFREVLRESDVMRIGGVWLSRLIDTTLAGQPDFSGAREELPVNLVAAYLIRKAGLDMGLVEGLQASAAAQCPSGNYGDELDAYFERQSAMR